mgnify:FL=1
MAPRKGGCVMLYPTMDSPTSRTLGRDDLIAELHVLDDMIISMCIGPKQFRIPAPYWNALLDAARRDAGMPTPPVPLPPQTDKNDPLMERQKVYGRGYEDPPRPKQCLVKGCINRATEGEFVGALCKPCHDMLTTGEPRNGLTFIHVMRDRLTWIGSMAAAKVVA